MSNRWLWLLKYLLIPLAAMLAGAGGMLWGMIRAGALTDKAMRGWGL